MSISMIIHFPVNCVTLFGILYFYWYCIYLLVLVFGIVVLKLNQAHSPILELAI